MDRVLSIIKRCNCNSTTDTGISFNRECILCNKFCVLSQVQRFAAVKFLVPMTKHFLRSSERSCVCVWLPWQQEHMGSSSWGETFGFNGHCHRVVHFHKRKRWQTRKRFALKDQEAINLWVTCSNTRTYFSTSLHHVRVHCCSNCLLG